MEGVVTDPRKLVSVVIPAYNEEDCVDELARRLQGVFAANPRYDFEVIVVENGSIDTTWEKLLTIHESDPRFKILRLARNFRMDGGLTAGLAHVKGDAAVLMTADLQDPPELISQFIEKWEEGYENVYGIVTARRGTGPIRTINSRLFYWVAGKLTDDLIPPNASDFRLGRPQGVRDDQHDGGAEPLRPWLCSPGSASSRSESKWNAAPRFGGVSNAHSFKVIDLAFKGIFAHSYVPLTIITLSGLTLSVLSIVTIIALTLKFIFFGVPFPGFGSIIALMLLLFGFLFLMLGVVAQYIGLIYEEVKQRPNFIVQAQVGL